MLLEHQASDEFVTLKMKDGFAWIIEKHVMLERRLKDPKEDTHNRYQFEQFEKEVKSRTYQLVKANPHKTVGLVDALFGGEHTDLITNRLASHKEQQYAYVNKLIELKRDDIKDSIQNYSLQKTTANKAIKYKDIMCIHLKLACELEPKSVLSIIEKAIKETFEPLEEYLKICQQYK